jgi:hypothetical protein
LGGYNLRFWFWLVPTEPVSGLIFGTETGVLVLSKTLNQTGIRFLVLLRTEIGTGFESFEKKRKRESEPKANQRLTSS